MKKMFFIMLMMIVLFCSSIWAQALVPELTPLSTPTPSPTPSPTACPCLMSFSFYPSRIDVLPDSDFQLDLNFQSNYERLAGYGFTFSYDPLMITPSESAVLAGDQGFLTAYNITEPGTLKVAGFDVEGLGLISGNFLNLYFSSSNIEGETRISLHIDELVDMSGAAIFSGSMVNASIRISSACLNKLGDVNGDNFINIVDALLIARYYVDQESSHITECAADVNNDGKISIVDALLVAQYYVGLVTEFK